jgi:hypothetical protein
MRTQYGLEILKKRGHWEELGVDGKMINMYLREVVFKSVVSGQR